MDMKKTGIVYRRAEGPFRYHAWPTVAVDEKGVLYTVFSGNRISHIDLFSKTYLVKSEDGGAHWSLPTVVNDTALDDRDAGICYLGGGRFAISYFCPDARYYLERWNHHMLTFMSPAEKMMALGAAEYFREASGTENAYGSFVRITEDGFRSIGSPVRIPISAPHGPISLSDGGIGYLGKAMFAEGAIEEESLWYYKSEDGGKSFVKTGFVPIPEGMAASQFHEPHAVSLGGGRLFGAYRTHDAKDPPLRTTVYFTSSEDGGKTWETLRPSGIDGLPPHLIRLRDGRLLLTYARRNAPNRIEAVISSDGGKSFGTPITVEEFPQHAYEGDFGYPATAELPDGTLVSVYYAVYGEDKKPSILCTKWTI